VLLGSFNPAIFQPQWFAQQDLLPRAEVDDAEIKVVSPQICDFKTARFRFQVIPERFMALAEPTTTPVSLRDLVLGTFFILEQTPVKAIGLNRDMHFELSTDDEWHQIGDKLAPKDGWNEVMTRPGTTGRVGMRVLVVEVQKEPKGSRLVVKVEPSTQVSKGVYFQVNDHYAAPESDALKTLMNITKTNWEGSYNYAAEIADKVLAWAFK
jgi:hypothetical protein